MRYPYTVGTGEVKEESRQYWQDEPHEYLVIVGGGGQTCFKGGNEPLYNSSVKLIGYIDLDTGEHKDDGSSLSWKVSLKEYSSGLYREIFTEGNVYRIRALPPVKGSGLYPLLILGQEQNDHLRKIYDDYIEEFNRPVFMHSDLFGEMPLNKKYGFFSAGFNWLGTEVDVSFNTDEKEDEKCLANLEQFCREAERRDKEVRGYAARELTDLANYWRDDDHLDHEITEEEFKARIRISSVEMSAEGNYDVWFDDDDMFAGHSVHVSGDAMGAPNYAQMEG